MTPSEESLVSPVDALLSVTRAVPSDDDAFVAEAPDWFGDRVFGGVVVGQALTAAAQTVDPPMRAHSVHVAFLGPVRPGSVDLQVQRLRDGRTFATRQVTSAQGGRTSALTTVSFHADEPGPTYHRRSPPHTPEPESLPVDEFAPPPFEVRWLGPTHPGPDGLIESTRRCWVRTVESISDDPVDHLAIMGFLSDMTGTSFRPGNLDEWGTHTDASIDHAVWFHRPFRADGWLFTDFHPVASEGGRSTVRAEFYDASGNHVASMAQELLVRPLGEPTGLIGPAV